MWPNYKAFFSDIFKKLLVSLISVPILSIGTILLYQSSSAAAFSYSYDWYENYWYLVLSTLVFALCQIYIICRYPQTVIAALILILSFCILYSIYRLNLSSIISDLPLWCIFTVFNLIVFQLAVVCIYLSVKLALSILQTP